MLRARSMWIRPSRLAPLAALVVLAPACKKKPQPTPVTRASASASALASAGPAPSASVALAPDAAPEDAAAANERAILAGTTPAGYRLGAFALRSIDESPGLAFGKAVEACALAGKFLCSEVEWQLACAGAPELAKTEAWTYSAERERAV